MNLQQIGIDQSTVKWFLAGAGVLVLAFIRHMPAPYEEQVWYGSIFDTLQDRCNNNDRVGLRRKRVLAAAPIAAVPTRPQEGQNQ